MRFRWTVLLVPGVCLLVAWLLSHTQPAFEWGDVLARLQVRHTGEYSRLAVLGLALIAIVAVLRICRREDE